MKNKVKSVVLFALIAFVSLASFIYLQSVDEFNIQEIALAEIEDTHITKNVLLPDVVIFKEVLKSFFNIIHPN